MVSEIEKHRRMIEDYEFDFARRVGRRVIEKPKISVWLVLLPILFVHYAQRIGQYKRGLQQFCDGMIHTRRFAMAAVAAELLGEKASCDYRESFLRAHPEPGPEAREVLRCQLAEIALLSNHYRRLLPGPAAADHPALIRRVYGNAAAYRAFLAELEELEEEVGRAVLKAFQPGEEAAGIRAKIFRWSRELREEEVSAIFS